MKIEATTEIEIFYTIFYAFFAFLLMTTSVVIFVFYARKKMIQKEIEKKDLEIKFQRSMLRATILIQEDERKRIARDLHDDISSKLNIISLNSHLLTSSNLSEKEAQQITTTIIEVTAKVLDSTRRIAHDLLPPILEEFGLHAAIIELCSAYTNGDSIVINYHNEEGQAFFNGVDVEKHLHFYRILQELINNSIRHGKAMLITITFEHKTHKNICKYADNGLGFDTNGFNTKKGLGLKNIESRMNFINGKFKIHSTVGKGVQVVLTF